MNFFAAHTTKLDLGWIMVVPEWFQSVDPVFIILLGPVFAVLWTWLARAGKEPSTPRKTALGLIVMGLGFVFMLAAAAQGKAGGLSSPVWPGPPCRCHAVGGLRL